LVIVILIMAILLPRANAAGAVISLSPSSTSVKVNDTFAVNVMISGVTDLFGYEFKISYVNTFMTLQSITKGSFFPNINMNVYKSQINGTGGYVWYAIALIAPEAGKNGDGTLATLTFKAVSTVTNSPLTFTLLYLSNSTAQPIIYAQTGGLVTIVPQSSGPIVGPTAPPYPKEVFYLFDIKIDSIKSKYELDLFKLKLVRNVSITVEVLNKGTNSTTNNFGLSGDTVVNYFVTSNNVTIYNSTMTVYTTPNIWKQFSLDFPFDSGNYTFFAEVLSMEDINATENQCTSDFIVGNIYIEYFNENTELCVAMIAIGLVILALIIILVYKLIKR